MTRLMNPLLADLAVADRRDRSSTTVPYSVPVPYTYPVATTPGTLDKHQ